MSEGRVQAHAMQQKPALCCSRPATVVHCSWDGTGTTTEHAVAERSPFKILSPQTAAGDPLSAGRSDVHDTFRTLQPSLHCSLTLQPGLGTGKVAWLQA